MTTRTLTLNGQQIPDPRSTKAWKRLIARVVAEEPECWLKFPGVCTTTTTTADHVIPVTDRPDLGLARGNVRGACQPCNERRRNTPAEALNLQPRPGVLAVFD